MPSSIVDVVMAGQSLFSFQNPMNLGSFPEDHQRGGGLMGMVLSTVSLLKWLPQIFLSPSALRSLLLPPLFFIAPAFRVRGVTLKTIPPCRCRQ